MAVVDSLKSEVREAEKSAASLTALIRGEVFATLPEPERDLLLRQRGVALELEMILHKRLKLWLDSTRS